MDYAEIKALHYYGAKCNVLRFNNKGCSCSETPKSLYNDMVNVQRLSDGVGVKPQADGGRKILTLIIKGLEIVYTLGNASGALYMHFIKVAFDGKYDNI